MRNKKSMSLGGVILAVALATALASTTAIASGTAGDRTSKSTDPTWTISALADPATSLPGVPAGVHAPSPAEAPTPGTVHSLGGGKAFAWRHGTDTCWNSGQPFGVATCGDSAQPQAFDFAIYPLIDPWPADGTQVAHVVGVAADGVTKVVATINDGATYTARVVENFFDIRLPADVPPWSVVRVSATTASGATYSHEVAMRPPSQLERTSSP